MIATFQVHPDVILLGIVTGMTYGVLGAGLVLIYRANRIINFAYGEIGALGAAVLGAAVTKWHIPYWFAFILALAAAALVGVACEVVVVRRFRSAPLVLTAIVTLGLGTILDSFSAIVSSTVGAGITYPQPSGFPSFFVGALLMTPAYSAMLILTPPFVIAVAIFLRRGRLGIAMRAAASNHDAALMSGMRAPRLSSLAWAMGGVMAAFTAILVLPTRGFSGGQFLGPGLLLRGLFCGVIAGMTSLRSPWWRASASGWSSRSCSSTIRAKAWSTASFWPSSWSPCSCSGPGRVARRTRASGRRFRPSLPCRPPTARFGPSALSLGWSSPWP